MRYFLLYIFLAVPAAAQERVIAALSGIGGHGQDTILLELNQEDPALLDLVFVTRSDFGWSASRNVERYEKIFPANDANIPIIYSTNITNDWGTSVTIGNIGCLSCADQYFTKQVSLQYFENTWYITAYIEGFSDNSEFWQTADCQVDLVEREANIFLVGTKTEIANIEDSPVPISQLTLEYRPKTCDRIYLSQEEWEAYRPDWAVD